MGFLLLAFGMVALVGGLLGEDAGGDPDAEGSDAAERFMGDEQANQIAAQGGDDLILGFQGDDVLAGGAGNDWILAGPGDDTVSGGTGNDVLITGAGDNLIQGGAGNDYIEAAALVDETVFADSADKASSFDDLDVRFNLDAPPDNADTIDAGPGDDTVIAGSGDLITLGAGADYLELGDWMLGDDNPDPAEIADFTLGEDVLAITHEDTGTALNIVIEQDEDDGMTDIYINDDLVAVARVSGGMLTPEDILVLTY